MPVRSPMPSRARPPLRTAVSVAVTVAGLALAAQPAHAVPEITIDDVSAAEGNAPAASTTLSFTVTLSEADTANDTTVDFATSDVEALAGEDYVAQTDVLTIPAGDTTGTIDVTVNVDDLDEIDETFLVTLSSPSANAVLGTKVIGVGTIQNDDTPPEVSIADPASITEQDGNLVFTLSLSKTAGRDLSVDFATADVTATAGADYDATSVTVAFAAGDDSRTVSVPIHDDALDELDETFTATLSNGANVTVAASPDDTATGTIVDDGDTPPTIAVLDQSFSEGVGTAGVVVTLDRPSGQPVTVAFATALVTNEASSADFDTSAAGTITFAPGETSQTGPVDITQDDIDEPDELFSFDLDPASPTGGASVDAAHKSANVTIVDDDDPPIISISGGEATENAGGGGDKVTFTVTLDHPSSTDITVDADTRDGTAVGSNTNGADYDNTNTSVTFPAGQTSRTFQVDTNNNNVAEPDQDFFVDLSNASPNASISTTAGTAEGIIHDDDADPTVQIQGSRSITEGNGGVGGATLSFDVTLSAGSEKDVTVDFAAASGTATEGADFTATSGTLDFGGDPSLRTLTVDVPITGDVLDEDNETFTVTLSNLVNTTIQPGRDVGTGTINDDDNQPTLSIADVSVDEGDTGTTTMSFVVALSAPSGRVITVDAATNDGTAHQPGDYAQTSTTLTFQPGDVAASVDVPVVGEDLFEPDETLTVRLSGASHATLPSNPDDRATGTIRNDDAEPTLSIADATLDPEGDTGARNLGFVVSLTNPSSQVIAFDFATSDGTATEGADYVATNSSAAISAGTRQTTVNIVVGGDTIDEPDETFNVTVSNVTNAQAGRTNAVGTIVDDDVAPTLSVVAPLQPATEGDSGTTTLGFDIALSAPTGQEVTVHVASQDDTAHANPAGGPGEDDYVPLPDTLLTFAPGDTVKHVDVTVKSDVFDEADQERFAVVLSSPVNAALGAGTSTGFGVINDDDATPTLSIDDVVIDPEGNTGSQPAVFTVTLSAVSGRDVTADFATGDGAVDSATADVDYGARSGTLTFPRGTTQQTVTVDVFGDTGEEADEQFIVGLQNVVNAVVSGTGAGTCIIKNDDSGPTTNTLDNQLDGFADGSPYAVDEEGVLTVAVADGVLKNDQDDNGDTLSAILADDVPADQGVLSFAADGSFVFTPAVDFAGQVRFTYQASDGTNNSAPQEVLLTVNNVNDDPALDATPFEVHQQEDDAAAAGLLVSDLTDALATDPDSGDALGVAIVGLPPAGGTGGDPGAVEISLDDGVTWTPVTAADDQQATLVPHDGRVRLAPPLNGTPTADIPIRAWDGHGGTAGGQVAVTTGADADFSSGTGTLRIIIDPVNDAPVFVAPTPDEGAPVTALEGTAFSIQLAADDVDNDAADLVFSFDLAASTLPASVDASSVFDAAAHTLSFTPLFTDAGTYTARFAVADPSGATDERDVTIDVAFIDADLDGLPDTYEVQFGLDPTTADSDGDGISDADEAGLTGPIDDLGTPVDTDGDGTIDALDDDSDDDGVPDSDEAGDTDLATPPPDSDGDGLADFRDENSDNDARDDGADNCRTVANDNQADLDGDNIGDACDDDKDGDRLVDVFEAGLGLDERNPDTDGDNILDGDEVGDPRAAADSDGDGTIDALETDSDDDGVPDSDEAGDDILGTRPVDTDGDGTPDFQDTDSDDDGILDDADNCRITANADQIDKDHDGVGDACLEVCGDGRVQEPEQCDDGNTNEDDLCNNDCTLNCDHDEVCNGVDDNCDGLVDIVKTSTAGGTHSVCDTDIAVTGGGIASSCGCAAGPDSGTDVAPALLLFGLALGATLRRRRRGGSRPRGARGAWGALVVVMVAGALGASHARAADGLAVEQLNPATAGPMDLIAVQGTDVNGHLRTSAGLVVDYAYRTLAVSDKRTGASVALLENRLNADVLASLSLFERAEVGIALPLTAFQSAGVDDIFVPVALSPVALGDMRVDGRYTFFGDDSGGPSLALAAAVSLPTGDPAQLEGYGFLTVEPKLIAGWRFGQRARAFLNLGYLVRPRQQLLGFAVGNELSYGAGASYNAIANLDVIAALTGRVAADPGVAVSAATAPLEGMVGARYQLLPGHDVSAAGSLGITAGYGTPLFRVLVGYTFTFTLPGGEVTKADPATLDRDHDGIVDALDKCPDIPEDKDGIQDEDGCPDVDADGDGIPDNIDQCPEVPEDHDGFEDKDGCPDVDKDGDGISDDIDKCPDQPEDRDGFQDDDGCPDPDNDGDGVPDDQDKCPNTKGPDNGCPEASPLVAPAPAPPPMITLPQRIYFKTSSIDVTTEGRRLLDQVAEALKHNTNVRVEVQGHSDAQGADKVNNDLSLRRAKAVIDILVEAGLPRQRFLIAVLADKEPLAPNDTPQGRALNRRVQFRVLPP